MGKNRLEAFSDAVLAIAITIMVLELKIPEGAGLDAFMRMLPNFLSYVLSFIYVGVALIWLVPDKRIERVIDSSE